MPSSRVCSHSCPRTRRLSRHPVTRSPFSPARLRRRSMRNSPAPANCRRYPRWSPSAYPRNSRGAVPTSATPRRRCMRPPRKSVCRLRRCSRMSLCRARSGCATSARAICSTGQAISTPPAGPSLSRSFVAARSFRAFAYRARQRPRRRSITAKPCSLRCRKWRMDWPTSRTIRCAAPRSETRWTPINARWTCSSTLTGTASSLISPCSPSSCRPSRHASSLPNRRRPKPPIS